MASLCQVLAIASISIFTCWARNDVKDWERFKVFVSDYKKIYKDYNETFARFRIFQESLDRQEKLNLLEKSKGGTAVYGVNKFSDLTEDEFAASRLTPTSVFKAVSRKATVPTLPGGVLPSSFDWRSRGVVTAIKDQKRCGSCWAFSVVETVESRAAILNFTLSALSTQEVLSCDPNQEGCGGGVPQAAFQWLSAKGVPLATEANYPFSSSDGKNYPCTGLPTNGVVVKSFQSMTGDEEKMRAALVGYSPLSVAVNANAWQDYIGEVMGMLCCNWGQ
jgi:hypothetical protein